jgi:hypothetical protein
MIAAAPLVKATVLLARNRTTSRAIGYARMSMATLTVMALVRAKLAVSALPLRRAISCWKATLEGFRTASV